MSAPCPKYYIPVAARLEKAKPTDTLFSENASALHIIISRTILVLLEN